MKCWLYRGLNDFNPRSPCGERPKAGTTGRRWPRFQSTFPLRGATVASLAFCWRLIFQSTFPLRGATRSGRQPVVPHRISIHVPLAGSDGKAGRRCTVSTYFNPRSPCGERPTAQHMAPRPMDFNPRSPCGERQATRPTGTAHPQFQSTFPLRGATGRGRWHDFHRIISIHAPLAGNDSCATLSTCDCRFQSTLPLRGATRSGMLTLRGSVFQSTLPLRGATFATIHPITDIIFQSTLPLRGATRALTMLGVDNTFQSTLPLRGATRTKQTAPRRRQDFNPRSPYGERPACSGRRIAGAYFNPRSPCGERHAHFWALSCQSLFQSTLPLRGAT